MSRPQFFIVTSAGVFILERILPIFTHWPIFIFPVFAIMFMLTSKNNSHEISYIVGLSFIFDFFSGYRFGFMTIVILVVVLAIIFFKTRFSVNSESSFSLAIYTLIFTFVYFALLSTKSGYGLIISEAAVIITETLILFFIFSLLFHKITKIK